MKVEPKCNFGGSKLWIHNYFPIVISLISYFQIVQSQRTFECKTVRTDVTGIQNYEQERTRMLKLCVRSQVLKLIPQLYYRNVFKLSPSGNIVQLNTCI